MKTIALCNQKGGVGKTTTTANLARAMSVLGQSVLVIDLDPQGNLTQMISAEALEADALGLADVLHDAIRPRSGVEPQALLDVAVETIWERVMLIPTVGDQLASIRDDLILSGAGRESRLRELLKSVGDSGHFGVVLIDCPPSLDQLTINALTASDQLVIVVHPDLFSLNGMNNLLGTIENVRSYYNPQLTIAGVLVNEAEEHRVSARYWRRELESLSVGQEWSLLEPIVPRRSAAVRRAMEQGVGLDELGSTNRAADLAHVYALHAQRLMGEAQ